MLEWVSRRSDMDFGANISKMLNCSEIYIYHVFSLKCTSLTFMITCFGLNFACCEYNQAHNSQGNARESDANTAYSRNHSELLYGNDYELTFPQPPLCFKSNPQPLLSDAYYELRTLRIQ